MNPPQVYMSGILFVLCSKHQLVFNVTNIIFTNEYLLDLIYMFTNWPLNCFFSFLHLISSLLFQYLSSDAPGRSSYH